MSYFLEVNYNAQSLCLTYSESTGLRVVPSRMAEFNDNSATGKGRTCRLSLCSVGDPARHIFRIVPVSALNNSKVLVARTLNAPVSAEAASTAAGSDDELFELQFTGNAAAYDIKSVKTGGYLVVDPVTRDSLITSTTQASSRFFTTQNLGTGVVIADVPSISYVLKKGNTDDYLSHEDPSGFLGVASNPARPTSTASLQFTFEVAKHYAPHSHYTYRIRANGSGLYLAFNGYNGDKTMRVQLVSKGSSDEFSLVRAPNDMGRFAIVSEKQIFDNQMYFLRPRASASSGVVDAHPLSHLTTEDCFFFVPCAAVAAAAAVSTSCDAAVLSIPFSAMDKEDAVDPASSDASSSSSSFGRVAKFIRALSLLLFFCLVLGGAMVYLS